MQFQKGPVPEENRMSAMGYINISLELFGGLLSLILILCLFINGSYKTRLGRLFVQTLLCHIVVLFSDAAAWGFKGNTALYAVVIVRAANFLVFSFGYVALAVFTEYLVTFIGARADVSRKIVPFLRGLCAAAILLVVVSQFTGLYYIIDENNIYRRQDWFWLSQSYGVAGMIINLAICLRYRTQLLRRDFFFLISYILFPVIAMVVQMRVYGLAFLNIGMTLSVVAIYLGIQVEQSKQKELELAENRTAIMLSQIQPHFLYNALTVIGELCDDDARKAKAAVTDFAHYLRGNLESLTKRGLIPFADELDHVETYLALEQLRFGDKLRITYEIGVEDFKLPPLTVQPIVENAVKHGISKRRTGGRIHIRTEALGQAVRITIADDGLGFAPTKPKRDDREHVGIANVRERLLSMCGGTLGIHSEPGAGTTATIIIPCPESEERAK